MHDRAEAFAIMLSSEGMSLQRFTPNVAASAVGVLCCVHCAVSSPLPVLSETISDDIVREGRGLPAHWGVLLMLRLHLMPAIPVTDRQHVGEDNACAQSRTVCD